MLRRQGFISEAGLVFIFLAVTLTFYTFGLRFERESKPAKHNGKSKGCSRSATVGYGLLAVAKRSKGQANNPTEAVSSVYFTVEVCGLG